MLADVNDSTVSNADGLEVVASAAPTIDALSLIGSAAVALGDSGFAVGGAGAGSGNEIDSAVTARIGGSDVVLRSGGIDVRASDASPIDADAGSAAAALGAGDDGVAIALAASVAINTIASEVKAVIEDSHVTSRAGVNVSGSSTASMRAFTFGLAGALAVGADVGLGLAGAGSGSGNQITDTITAAITDSTVAANGAVTVTAIDHSDIDADAGVAGLAVGASGSVGIGAALGASAAKNIITNATHDTVDHSTLTGVSAMAVTAESTATIDATTGAGIASVGAGGDVGVAFSGAGAVSLNNVRNTIDAKVENGSAVALKPGAPVTVSATDSSAITADGGAGALAIGAGLYAGVGAAPGASVAVNDIANHTTAAIDTATFSGASAGPLKVTADSHASIDALAVTISGALGAGIVGAAFAGAGAAASNVVHKVTEAQIAHATIPTAAGVTVRATDDAAIDADTSGASLAGGLGVGSVNLTIGASVSVNEIGNHTSATIDDSTVTSTSAVTVQATSAAEIDANAVGIVLSAGVSAAALNMSGVGSVTTNKVANTTEALVTDSNVTANGAVRVEADDATGIHSDAVAGAISATFSPIIGGSVTVTPSVATNDVANAVHANVDHSTVNANAGKLEVLANSTSDIDGTAVAAAVDVLISALFFNAAGAGANVSNSVANDIEASVTGSQLSASQSVKVAATDVATVDAVVSSTAVQGGISGDAIGIALTDNTVNNTIAAFTDGGSVAARGGDVEISATATQTVHAKSVAVALAVSLGGAGVGATANSSIGGSVDAHASGTTLSSTGDTKVAAASTLTATADASGGAGGVVGISAMLPTADITGTTTAYVNGTVTVTGGNLDVSAESTNLATADTVSVGLGVVTGVGGGAHAHVGRTVDAHIGAAHDATPVATHVLAGSGAVSVNAESNSTVTSHANGGAGAAVAISVFKSEAKVDGSKRAYVAQATSVDAGSLTVGAKATERATAGGIVVSVAAINGMGATADAIISTATEAFVGPRPGTSPTGAAADIDVSGAVVVSALTNAAVDATLGGGDADALGVTVLLPNATIDNATRAAVGANVKLEAGSLDVTATAERREATTLNVLAGIHILGGGGAATANATVKGFVEAPLGGASSTIDVTGPVKVIAQTELSSAHSKAIVGSGSIFADVAVATANATNEGSTKASIADGTNVLNAGRIESPPTARAPPTRPASSPTAASSPSEG